MISEQVVLHASDQQPRVRSIAYTHASSKGRTPCCHLLAAVYLCWVDAAAVHVQTLCSLHGSTRLLLARSSSYKYQQHSSSLQLFFHGLID